MSDEGQTSRAELLAERESVSKELEALDLVIALFERKRPQPVLRIAAVA